MTLEDLGNIGEFVGAIGVVASLIYLAFQIRQSTSQMKHNTRALEVAAFDTSIQQGFAVRRLILSSDALTEIWLQGCVEYPNLDQRSRARFNLIAESVFYATQGLHARVEAGAMHSELLETQLPVIARLLSQPGLGRWWERNQGMYGPSFIRAIEEARREAAA